MGRFLFVLFLLAAGVLALGLYMGWFNFSTSRDTTGGQTDIKFRIDEKKIESDAEKAKEKVKGAFDRTHDNGK